MLCIGLEWVAIGLYYWPVSVRYSERLLPSVKLGFRARHFRLGIADLNRQFFVSLVVGPYRNTAGKVVYSHEGCQRHQSKILCAA